MPPRGQGSCLLLCPRHTQPRPGPCGCRAERWCPPTLSDTASHLVKCWTGWWQESRHGTLLGALSHAPSRPRAMVQSHCRQIRVVLPQLLPALRSQEEPERKVAILFLTEVGPGRAGGPQRPPKPLPSSAALAPHQDPHLTLTQPGGGGGLTRETPHIPPPHSGAPGWGPHLLGPPSPSPRG